MAIIGLHALMYSKKDEETRKFFRDVLGFQAVDAGRGWLIFSAPPAELAIHPAEQNEHSRDRRAEAPHGDRANVGTV